MSYFCDPYERWFNDLNGYQMHIQNSASHGYRSEQFDPCKRMFMNQNNLNQHLHSRIHIGSSNIRCPFCKGGFTSASGVTIHLESGTCPKANIDRHGINRMIQQLDTNHVITKKLLTYPNSSNTTYIATDRSWNGHAYQCYLCSRQFAALPSLNNHINSPVHEQNLYHCPGRGCGREYKALSGLVQHVESESCGVMRFATVQRQAKSGIQNMVGRMITG
ncbi:hypothetical protein BDZ45DRAFT_747079 [Acephala macrosclerotiorum]|nr:hypothetical protein BDZ45DRAFT_747079 [Acephala macrosclerotiorum]